MTKKIRKSHIRVVSKEMGFKAVWHFANRRELEKWRKERFLIELLEKQKLVEIPRGLFSTR